MSAAQVETSPEPRLVKLVAELTQHSVKAGMAWLMADPAGRGLGAFLEDGAKRGYGPPACEQLLRHFIEHRLLFFSENGPIDLPRLSADGIDRATGLAIAAHAGEEAAARAVEDGIDGGLFVMSLIAKWGAQP